MNNYIRSSPSLQRSFNMCGHNNKIICDILGKMFTLFLRFPPSPLIPKDLVSASKMVFSST